MDDLSEPCEVGSRAAGFDDHLSKPVDPHDVEAVLSKLLDDDSAPASYI
jgi:CheY-like chemotaxis protein